MTRAIFAAALAAVLCLAEARADDWSTTDKVLLGGALGTLAIDWAQARKTTTIAVMPQGCLPGACSLDPRYRPLVESNPILGPTPSNAEINRYFILWMAGTVGLSYVLPRDLRRLFLGSVIVVESHVIYDNNRIGVRIGIGRNL